MNETTERSGSLLTAIRDHLGGLQAKRTNLVERLDAAKAEIDRLYLAPVHRDDALQFCLDYIDARASASPLAKANLGNAIDRATWPRRYDVPAGSVPGMTKTTALNLRDIDAGLSGDQSHQNEHFADGLNFFGAGTETARFDDLFYFFFGPTIKAKLCEHFDSFYSAPSDAEIGPPVEDRRARIAVLEAELAGLSKQIADIDAEMAAIRAGATAAPKSATEAKAVTNVDLSTYEQRMRDREIYRDFNGRNAEELAQRYGVPVAHVNRIGIMLNPPEA